MDRLKYIYIPFIITTLTSCVSIGSKVAPAYVDAFKAIKNAVVGFEDAKITKEIINKIPYASALLKIGKGPQGLLILESTSSDKQTWISADGIYLVIENGRVIKTTGLNNNLIDFRSPISDFNDINEKVGVTYKYYYSYDFPSLRDLEVVAKLKIRDKEEVAIFSETFDLLLIEEEIANAYLGWSYTNKYWVDEDLRVIKSIQKFSPKLPEFTMVITKKPSL